ncbi:zinc dependent phospholipase C family protein [Lutispora saccharofermentans]|uniref:Phospholipase C n=1 Tax=Lutispora saccharofermentans TaxID=3024236 RepID=A0ABT1NDA4_9FIRM|nr:zinc dependent phospholipase C family protein [Lutispora saccharofermentans]MCQ1528153.1 zinc dependent phospholipase C family protein [Lutispora saccharofermentans]
MSVVEKVYGRSFKTILWFAVPFKKYFVQTFCQVHMFINKRALEILKNDGHREAYEFFLQYLDEINKGVYWADQDFRSREHFYNPYTHRGLYGCKNSRQRFARYYGCAKVYWDSGDKEMAMTYLGAAVHLIQDSTVPQHGDIYLLKSHRRFEQWIKAVHDSFENYAAFQGGIYLENPYDYIERNAKDAIAIYRRYSLIERRRDRFYRIAGQIFPMAQRTTAGCFLNFYNEVGEKI